jgi:hypothetical protein
MNERIKELMKGCFDVTVDSRGREECTADFINVQKFAELIVQEAAAFVSGAAEVYNQAEQDACVRASKGLKKYFGVEE